MNNNNNNTHGFLKSLAREYWDEPTIQHMLKDVERIAFHLSLIGADKSRDRSVCDVGGGVSMFSLACAALGMKSTLVDDFGDPAYVQRGMMEILGLYRSRGVTVISRDVIRDGIGELASQSFDAITTFDSMEHWHNSPKRLFHQLVDALKPGGIFVIGVPNCVNLRKRITVPFGKGKWTQMSDWYEPDVFRSHVREPDVDDLRYIAKDLGLKNVRIVGKNWAGYDNSRPFVRAITPFVDSLLQLAPSLCGDIYLVANKP
jgi:2-polyprenyl-3-methyl-5-hydroxy-6-metoxy-1,4-benzoquinol methylase